MIKRIRLKQDIKKKGKKILKESNKLKEWVIDFEDCTNKYNFVG